ncbi:hypothetical protein PMAYCL1PPCAC_10272, partial [Pristionchus mayeri]
FLSLPSLIIKMSFAQFKSAIKSRFIYDSVTVKDQSTHNKILLSSSTCPNFSFGDSSPLPIAPSSNSSTASPKTSTASGDWGSREH